MKKLFFIIGLFFSLSAVAQPTNYTKINMRYRWLSGMFDSALYVPRYNGTPSGVRVNETSAIDGMIAMDTTNNRLYIYSGGSWIRLAAYSEIAAYTAGNGLTLSGSQFKLGGTLSENTNIVVDNGFRMGFDLDPSDAIFSVSTNNSDTVLKIVNDNRIYLPQIFTVSSTTGRKVALIDTATGKVERIDPATLVTTPTLQQVLTAGSTLTTNNEIELDGTDFTIVDNAGGSTISLVTTSGSISLQSLQVGDAISELVIVKDSITLKAHKGQINIDSLRTWSGISDTTYKKPMTWDTRNGRWEYAANWYGGGGGGTVSSASGTGVSLVNGSSLIKRLKEGTGITITDNTDSVTVSRVSDSTMVRNLRWKYRNTFELMDEFLGNGVAPGWSSQSSGAGSSAGSSDFMWADLDTTWQGATYASTGTTTTGRGLCMYGNTTSSNTGSFRGYNTSFAVYETRVRFDTLSNATNEYTALFGWMDWFGSSFYQKGMKFVYDRATYGDFWVLRSDDGGTSAVVTTTAVAAKTDYVLRIEVYNWQMGSSGGSIKAYINDVEVVASSGTYPIVSNIAKTDAFYPCYWIQKSAGTVARKVFLDWLYQYAEFIKRL